MSISGRCRSRQHGGDVTNIVPTHGVGYRRSLSTNIGYYINGAAEVGVAMPPLKRRRFSSSSSSSSTWQQGGRGAQYWPSNGVVRRNGVSDDGPSTSNNLFFYQKMMGSRLGVPDVNACAFPVCDKSDSVKLALDEDPIFMSKDEIERCSPSRKDGIDVCRETHLRYSYCAFLQNLGIRLVLPQTTIATAMVLCHRFFVLRSHACHDRFLIATAALFLAAKSEETPTPLNNVVKASTEICHKQNMASYPYMFSAEWYEKYRELIIETEQLILTTLDFELNVQHPYTHLMSVLNKLGFTQSVLANMAWNVISQGVMSRIICLCSYLVFFRGGLASKLSLASVQAQSYCCWSCIPCCTISEYRPWFLPGCLAGVPDVVPCSPRCYKAVVRGLVGWISHHLPAPRYRRRTHVICDGSSILTKKKKTMLGRYDGVIICDCCFEKHKKLLGCFELLKALYMEPDIAIYIYI